MGWKDGHLTNCQPHVNHHRTPVYLKLSWAGQKPKSKPCGNTSVCSDGSEVSGDVLSTKNEATVWEAAKNIDAVDLTD